jgi:diguanylate cyclase (GGDEF)-like protein
MMVNCNTIIDSINVGILSIDVNLNVYYYNKWVAIHSDFSLEEMQGKNLLDLFDISNEKLKSLKRHIKAALTLNSPSFFTADANNYLLPMKNSTTTKSIFEFMQQDVTIMPYDIEKKIVTMLIYDQTSLMEEKARCNKESTELAKAVKLANATIRKLETARNKLVKQQDIIYKQAHYDHLTALANRTLLHQRMQLLIENNLLNGKKFGVLFLDLDNFKEINDSLGHDVGDMILIHVAKTLLLATRKTDTVARFGGDEFIILVDDVEDEKSLNYIASKLVHNLQQPIRVRNLDLGVTTSIGISLFPDHGTDFNQLIKNADLALYMAKAAGRNTYRIYAPPLYN